jgi:hypothetical protein
MRPSIPLVTLAVLLAAGPALDAQAVERADTPRRGALRVTFDPRIMTWERQFSPAGRQGIGAAFSGDSIAAGLPSVVRLQQDVRSLTGLAGYIASLGHELLAIRAERRVTPIRLEYGVTSRLSVGVTVPIVRVQVREGYQRSPPGANLGALPQTAADSARYLGFFADLDAALGELDDSITAGGYGGPGSPAYIRAQALLAQGQMLRFALARAVYGTPDTAAQYLPLATSEAGRRLTSVVDSLGRALADSFHIEAFSQDTFLLPSAPLSASAVAALYADRTSGLDLSPYGGNTLRRLRFFPGDVEVSARYRVIDRHDAATTLGLLVRLPTGHQDSPNDPFDLATGDHQTDVEGQWVQEMTLWNRLWLNLNARVGAQLAGQRERRLARFDDPFAAGPPVLLRWDPGDYVAVDFAPMYRFSRRFAAGLTGSYYVQGTDHYFAPGSVALPANPQLLDAGTAVRIGRLGLAMTYAGPRLEGGLSLEQTVSGAGGLVPVATVFRIVLRQSIPLF